MKKIVFEPVDREDLKEIVRICQFRSTKFLIDGEQNLFVAAYDGYEKKIFIWI